MKYKIGTFFTISDNMNENVAYQKYLFVMIEENKAIRYDMIELMYKLKSLNASYNGEVLLCDISDDEVKYSFGIAEEALIEEILSFYKGKIVLETKEEKKIRNGIETGKIGAIEELKEEDFDFDENDSNTMSITWTVSSKEEVYGEYNIGDVVLIGDFFYSNGEKGSEHPFIIVDKNNKAVPIEYIVFIISSNLRKLRFDSNIFIERDSNNGLRFDSLIKTDKEFFVPHNKVKCRLGTIDNDLLKKIIEMNGKNESK